MQKISVIVKCAGLALVVALSFQVKMTSDSGSDSQLLAGRYHQRSHAASALGRTNGVRSSRSIHQNHWDHVRPGAQPGRRPAEMIATKPEVGTRS